MRTPFKVIHKYKNFNNNIGYKIYIFIGSLIDKEVLEVLEGIKNLSFIDTLIKISKKDYSILENTYGEKWFNYFFNKHHIYFCKIKIKKNKELITQLTKKYNSEWINRNLSLNQNVSVSTAIDKYSDYIKNILKSKNKLIQYKQQKGGDDDINDEDIDEEDEEDLFFNIKENQNDETTLGDLNEINLDNIIIDEDTIQTKKEIDSIIHNNIKKNDSYDYSFQNDTFENFQDNQEIQNIYEKIYIHKNFIFLDDNIYKIKSKICDSIKLNDKFKNIYLIPSRIYLWSEYYSPDGKLDKIMIGSKWIKKSELWDLDIEPKNDIQVYVNLSSKKLEDLNYAYKKYSTRIKRDDDEQLILNEYSDFINNDELYMIDVYTQLNLNFTVPESKTSNLINTFIRIYFPHIVIDVSDILLYLQNQNNENENKKIDKIHKTIRNDLSIEREIVKQMEETKIGQKMFTIPYIIQTVVHVNLRIEMETLNLRKIFDNFILNNNYPFTQLQLSHEKPIRNILKNSYFDSFEKTRDKAVHLKNWLKSNSFGLTIKVLASDELLNTDRFLTITISENGRIQYKIQWKEENKTKIEEISLTYKYINQLIDKINKENELNIKYPLKPEYKYVFINSMEQFNFTSKINKINHNDLSDFARLFFPYVSVVIEPKKRIAKDKTNNQMSKWGTYLRFKKVSNYEDDVRMSKRIVYYLKNYEIDETSLVKVIESEYNITEKEAKQKILEVTEKFPVSKKKGKELKKLETMPVYKPPGVAIEIQGKTPENYKIKIIGSKNEFQMNEITTFIRKLLFLYQETYLEKKEKMQYLIKKLEKLTNIAKRRFFVKDIIEKDETDSYYAIKKMRNIDPERLGTKNDKNQYTRDCQNSGNVIRRPQQLLNEKQLVHSGYKYNPESKLYEKVYKTKDGKSYELIALKFESPSGPIYYICDPDINKERKFIGVLSKSSGVLPCCFKKNQKYSNNIIIKNKFLEALGLYENVEENIISKDSATHILYIKHFSNKITNQRLYFLPELLDTFFNIVNNKIIKKTAKLELAQNGYFLLFGISVTEYKFLQSIAYITNNTVNQIKNTIIKSLKSDVNNVLFTSLNNGEIKNKFDTKKNFINFIENSEQLEFFIIKDLISYIYKFNFLIFEFNPIKNDYNIICTNFIDDYDYIIMIKDNYDYSLIIEVTKKSIKDKSFDKKITFSGNEEIIKNILDFFTKPCIDIIDKIDINYYKSKCKENIIYQYLDSNNKVNYVINKNKNILPVFFSGAHPEIPILEREELKKYIVSPNEQLDILKKYNFIIPISFLLVKNNIEYIKIKFKKGDSFIDYEINIPVKSTKVNGKLSLPTEEYKYIDINNVNENDNKRHFEVNLNKIYDESFQLYRLELSNYFEENSIKKNKILNILNSKNTIDEKKKLVNISITKINSKIVNIKLSLKEWIQKKHDEILNYKLNNIRTLCSEKVKSIHCYRNNISFPKEWIKEYTMKVVISIVNQDINGKEILREDKYFVSDVVDNMNFTFRNNQMTIKGNEFNIQKIIDELYGEGILPNLGKKKNKIVFEEIDDSENPLIEYNEYYIQKVIPNNNSILRGLVNGFYYLLNREKYDISIINLKYISELQTNLVNYFKGKIITWLKNNMSIKLPNEINMHITEELLIEIHKSFQNDKYWILILWSFYKITNISICIKDNNNNNILYIDNNKICTDCNTIKINPESIFLRLSFNSYNKLPAEIEVLYNKKKSRE